MGCTAEESGFNILQGQEFFFSSQHRRNCPCDLHDGGTDDEVDDDDRFVFFSILPQQLKDQLCSEYKKIKVQFLFINVQILTAQGSVTELAGEL
jgi:hypothetical protein